MSAIQNPMVPFDLPIPGGMGVGKMVTVQGMVPPQSERFAVNLICNTGDLALHISPKFRENLITRNHVTHMTWGPEENSGPLTIFPGQGFEIIILCEQNDFKIAINGRHFTEFKHRLPFSRISNIAVDGEVMVHNVYFKDSNSNVSSNVSNNTSNPNSYGFQPARPPSPYANAPGGLYPQAPQINNEYNNKPTPGFHSNLGPQYSPGPSPFPQQPNYGQVPNQGPYPQVPHQGPYPQVPHQGPYPQTPHQGPYPQTPHQGPYPQTPYQGPYPQVPNQNSQGYTPTPSSKPGFLNQAGMALAGVLGPTLLAKGMKKNSNTFGQTNGRPDFLRQAAGTLAGLLGGAGCAGNSHHNHSNLVGGALGTAIAGAALTGHLNPIKAAKKQKKAHKKALKYGLPLAGAGLGAYALHKGFKGFRRSSSSSSCSSSD